jgi:glycerophosphoryl diester phosphodiesterase
MKILIVSIVTFFYSNEKLVGLWKSIDDNSIQYLNIKSNGVFLEIKDKTTSRFNYKEKENTLQIEMENGNIKEESFYMSGDTLIIQSISDGNLKKNKFIKERLVL